MDNYTYLDVYAKTYLNEIKERIRWNKIQLSGDIEKETDEFIIEVIKSLCIKPRHNLSDKESYIPKVLPTDSKEDSERIFRTLMLYYVAIYNDNIELLNKLLESGYNCNGSNLFVLDKRISSQFDTETYIKLIKNQTELFKEFYLSLQDRSIIITAKNTPDDNVIKELSEEEIIKIFANILKKNPNIAISKRYYNNSIRNLLTKTSINYFGEDIILNATEEQKENIISRLTYVTLTKKALNRLITLMTNHEFSTNIYEFWNAILSELTYDELIQIDSLDKDLFRDVWSDINSNIYANGVNKNANLYM